MPRTSGSRDLAPPRAKRAIAIDLCGQRFQVRSDEDEAYLEELAHFVSAKVAEIQRATGIVETSQVALLAALDIADDLFRQRREHATYKSKIEDRARGILGKVDQFAAMFESGPAVAAEAMVSNRHATGRAHGG